VLGHIGGRGKQEAQGGVSRFEHQVPRSYSTSLPASFLNSLARVGVRTNSQVSPVASLFTLPSYRASFLVPFPSSMAMVIFVFIAVLMVVTLVGLLLWFFFLSES